MYTHCNVIFFFLPYCPILLETMRVCVYLLIRSQRCKKRDDITLYIVQLQYLGKLAQFGSSSTPHHGRIIRAKGTEVPIEMTSIPQHTFSLYLLK